ncbi:HNH endonuclease signature motif containing protein [Zeaxanthinibacter sp. PT1]|uniref:HNH endonuclease signature motif containing protein n=1 Tax=Zeaxanthinibacter TaxID=561554 RepID=UPI00234B7F6B|nr:HNH endonuclease signature motif containing protein [Zeaxanthinibacter sp. PT1]MDC6350465.1 HNH endonuclease signature motif containing protein [Zeaxanthinibacter sp. PT1]
MAIYKFTNLDKFLDERGYPKVQIGSGYRLIKGVDFEKAFREGSIEFREDGIYLDYEGTQYRGYMFISHAYVRYNGGPKELPKFHLIKCTTIQSFIQDGRFKKRYEWSNAAKNDIRDIQSDELYKDETLELCANCRRQIAALENDEDIYDTKDFNLLIEKLEEESEGIEVDIFGYPKDHNRISKLYRTSRKFTCESCGITPRSIMDRRYWHTHHINGDKTDNRYDNLECLCVLCHANKDHHHQQNFSSSRMKGEIHHFIARYQRELEELKNSYLEAVY